MNLLQVSEKTKDILSYESTIWASADVLRSTVGLKNSDFPDYMMPFFALMLVESRLIRLYDSIKKDPENSHFTEQDIIDEVKDNTRFYNSFLIEKGIPLRHLVKDDHSFKENFEAYLDGFDDTLKSLLGIVNSDKAENLNFDNIKKTLNTKKSLQNYLTYWTRVDLTPYDNSEVTTLEEHIKRKWADMSADTAGEHYTPADIINLISELILINEVDINKTYTIYDMTCGGGNMVFGVEDRLKETHPGIITSAFGQELNGALYSLAKIESMFRLGSEIEQGNTLTDDKFDGRTFMYGCANPPYGVSWKDIESAVKNDTSGRFGHGGYPSVSDGQLLFIEHMLAKLNEEGKAFIVLNSSPLSSGGAGSGESEIRKWILENDYVEAFIQLPPDEFFNTNIVTYVWCLNKNKPEFKKDKILMIDASEMFVRMRKSKGKKSKEIPADKAKEIARIYYGSIETEISKVISKYAFYYNYQKIEKLEKDDEFGFVEEDIELNNVVSVIIRDKEDSSSFEIIDFNSFTEISKEEVVRVNKIIKDVDSDLYSVSVLLSNGDEVGIDENNCVFTKSMEGVISNLGYGSLKININYVKGTKSVDEHISMSAKVSSVWTKDDERIEFSNDKDENDALIMAFLLKWVSKDETHFKLLANKVGVEVNFNRFFYKMSKENTVEHFLTELEKIDLEMEKLK